MIASVDTALTLYQTGLRNQHGVENQAIELLQRQLERLEHYPAMSERIRQHIGESQAQAQRLEELLQRLGTSGSSVKDALMSVMGNMAALAHVPAPDEVLKNTLANFAFEHFEIASYESLLVLAELSGRSDGTSALQQSLCEEQAMARWIQDHIAETTRTFVMRSAAGEKAGV